MVNHTQSTKTISLEKYGIKNANVRYQLSPKKLHIILRMLYKYALILIAFYKVY